MSSIIRKIKRVVSKKDGEEVSTATAEHTHKVGKSEVEFYRFNSFAPERSGNLIKWHVDGHDYLYAVSELLDNAKESILILDWWLTPELYLRRPPAFHPEWRLDRLLKRKAEQGVKVYVIVYNEVPEVMSMDSYHTQHALEDLHENISCMRHPDHLPERLFEKDIVEYWSHHEKVVVVDRTFACIGGIDLSFGRWDTSTHPLADVHPTEFSRTLFPGQDYNNARLMDFQEVQKFAQNELSILASARMPWHDIHMTIQGMVVSDIVRHFIQRWNFIKSLKYQDNKRYPQLDFHSEAPAVAPVDTKLGTNRAQVIRSVSKWSHGVDLEKSIQEAYIRLIKEAEHFVYIENQFFITNTGESGVIKNLIGKAIVERVIAAAQSNSKFKIVIVIPEVPGFAGSVRAESSIQKIMAAQYLSINRGGHSIFEAITAAGYDPNEYIRFYNLRAYDRINAPYKSFIKKIEENSGVSFQEAQVALGVQWTGPPPQVNKEKETIKLRIIEPGSPTDGIASSTADVVAESVTIPANEEEARQVIAKFERGAESLRSDQDVADNVVQHMLKDTTTLWDEKWDGTPEEELECYVSELVYIHAKVLIADDRRVILGSPNFNDRSQNGDRDSEIALVVEDEDMVDSVMNGQPYKVSRFAASLRRRLWKEHLGMIRPELPEHREEEVTSFMRPVPHINDDTFGSPDDDAVADPLAEETIDLWNGTAKKNTEIFAEVFRPVPADHIRNWDQYKQYAPHVKAGHVVPGISLEAVKEKLSQVKGSLETFPLKFLEDQKDFTENFSFDTELDPTIEIYT